MKFQTTISFTVEVEADVSPFCKGDPQTMDGPGSPDEPASSEITSVKVGGWELLNYVEKGELEALEEQALTTMRERDEAAHDDQLDRNGDS